METEAKKTLEKWGMWTRVEAESATSRTNVCRKAVGNSDDSEALVIRAAFRGEDSKSNSW